MGFWDKLNGIFGGRDKEQKNGDSETERRVDVKEVTNANWEEICCPYCFEKFSHKEVHFRSNTVKNNVQSDEYIEEHYGDDEELMQTKLEDARIARKFMLQGNDEKLEDFWSRFKITPDQRDDDGWKNPIIRPDDKEMLYHGGKDGMGLIYQDEFLTRVQDRFAGVSTVRLCPHCHNKLPSTYGKHKVIFISVVGITGSGKTVYLNQLMESLQKHLSCAGLVATQPFNLRPNERIAKNSFLPMSTQEGVLYPPMMINIIPNGGVNGKDDTTLVFYDIAGENCTDADKLFKFGPYLLQSQAIIMLMDPKQFKEIDENAGENPVNTVLDELVRFFDTSGSNCRPLMAATLSKSDKLKDLIDNFMMEDLIQKESVIFKKIRWDGAKKGFYKSSYQLMKGAMINLMKALDPYDVIQGPLKQHFSKTAFFAVSALGVEVQPKYNIGSKEDSLYVDLTKEAEQAISMLKKPPKNGYVQEPPLYKNRKQVMLGYHPDDGEEVIKSFEEIKMNDNSVEYWLNENPDPYRIEEPLLWALSELKIINSVDA